ncbi:MAG: hypothetical protein JWQ89_2185 [Devosia sp.]|uniref:hypothetical protein n=1 Tax=Devosia sp. TaxID=1871048 RepID=UPI00261575DA|nr:hypothetical protein [Devosia sp.]MDB5540458.1 hypothetical protein [Devosia sp.]
MKSFSSSSFASNHAEALDLAFAAVQKNPQALFTNFQWFLFAGKDTIFFTAFSKEKFDKTKLKELVAQVVGLAPQLTHGFIGARPGHPFTDAQLDAITSVEMVDSLDGYPDKWLSKSADIFDHPDLPLFRFMAATLKGGPDAEGRVSVIQVRAAHCVLEGSDSALLSRSQSANHGIQSNKANKVSFGARFKGALQAAIGVSLHLFFAHVMSPPDKPWGFKTLALRRDRLRSLANRLGVRQRSLYFALVTHALHSETDRRLNAEVITAAYTMLDTRRTEADDDFFRVRALMAKFPYRSDFVEYAHAVDDALSEIENKDITSFQVQMLALFAMHRKLHRAFRFLYGPRFWRFSGRTDTVLTLVPPHRTFGPVTDWMVEPIYCGAYHSASNIATFCPGRDYMTVNFTMEERNIEMVDRIEPLIAAVEAMDLPAPKRSAPEVAEA